VAENAGGAGPYTARYTYNPNDQPLTASYPNGAGTTMAYDPNGALTGLTLAGPSTGIAATTLNTAYAYGYNAAGWTTGTTTISGTDTLAHDGAGRLTSDCGQQPVVRNTADGCYRWTYDGNDNVASQVEDNGATEVYTYSQNQPNALLQTTALQANVPAQDRYKNPDTYYGYDGHGDTTAITSPVNGAYTDTAALNTHLQYDALARPVQVTKLAVVNDNAVVPMTVTTAYGADGLRDRYTVRMSGTVTLDERFQYRAAGELAAVSAVTATLNADGSVKSQGAPSTDTYLYGASGEPLELIRQQGGATNRYWYALDGEGSIVAVTDSAGKVVDRYTYDSWGEQVGRYAEGVQQQLRYRGYWYDSELGWYWLGQRHYDPEELRYLQPDPTDLDGVRTYAYANGDPVDEVDLAGLFTCPSGRIAHDWGWVRVSLPGSGKALHAACEELDHLLRTHGVAGGLDPIAGAFNVVVGDDIHTALTSTDPKTRAWAIAMIVLTVVPEAKLIKLLKYAPWVVKAFAKVLRYVAESAHVHIAPGIAEMAARLLQKGRVAIRGVLGGCTCFPVGTLVATPGGLLAINALQPGQPVLAEDPTTGVAEPEVVQAVIDDGAKPLMALDLSDGEAITVTADHPFYVDKGALLGKAGWLHAGDLMPGDRPRTAGGRDAVVVGVRRDVGHAEVYTLTVAKDHTFFVGSARVLVHNAICPIVDKVVLSDLLQKGVHVKVSGVELSVLPGYGGSIVFKAPFSTYSRQQVDTAVTVAQSALRSNPEFVNRLYGAAQRALRLAQDSRDSKLTAKAAEFAFLMKALRKLGAG